MLGCSLASAVLALVVMFRLFLADGRLLIQEANVSVDDLPLKLDFDLRAQEPLIRVRLSCDVDNGWAWFDLELEPPEAEETWQGVRNSPSIAASTAKGP